MENLLFHSSLTWRMIILAIITISLKRYSLGRLGECTLWTWNAETIPRFGINLNGLGCHKCTVWAVSTSGCISPINHRARRVSRIHAFPKLLKQQWSDRKRLRGRSRYPSGGAKKRNPGKLFPGHVQKKKKKKKKKGLPANCWRDEIPHKERATCSYGSKVYKFVK